MTSAQEQKIRDRIQELEKQKADTMGEEIAYIQGRIDEAHHLLIELTD